MAPPRVSLIHSDAPADRELRDALCKHLSALPITFQDPPGPGLPRRQALREQLATAALALVLVSKDLAGDEDACAALADAAAPLVPVLLSAFAWEIDPRLAPLHGREVLPRGGAPLVQARDRDQALRDITAEVDRLLRQRRPAAAPSPARSADPLGLRALWVELTRRDAQVAVRCFNPYHGAYGEALTAPPRARDPDGAALFGLLFPDDAVRDQALRDLALARAGDPQPAPPRLPVRLRIVTRDPVLAALPWARTSYQGEPLRHSGWTFALCPACERGPRGSAPYPLKVLLWTDRPDAPLRGAVEELLRRHQGPRLSPSLYRHVSDAADAADALNALRPSLVLLQGAIPPARLAAALRDHPPRLLASASPAAPADLPALLELCRAVPLQLWPRPDGDEALPQAERLLRRWLEAALHGGRDPVEILYDEWPAAGDPLQVFAHYDDLELAAGPGPRRLVAGPLALDRDEARALAARHVKELIDSPTRRVEVLIAHGGDDDLLEHLGEQAREAVKQTLGVVVHRVRGAAPRLHGSDELRKAQARALPQRLEDELRTAEGARPETPVWTVLRQHLSARRGAGPQVLWLDYGVFGGEGPAAQPALLPRERAALAEFARDRLGRECPAHVRVVVFLGCRVEASRQEKLRANLEKLESDPLLHTERFRFTLLPALGRVTLRHLRDYTSDPLRSRCESSLAAEAAARIHQRSRGVYAEAVALLQRGEAEGYAALLQDLRGAAPDGGDDDDED